MVKVMSDYVEMAITGRKQCYYIISIMSTPNFKANDFLPVIIKGGYLPVAHMH